MTVQYREIAVGSDLHRSEQALRDAVLRRPLGRPLSAEEMDRDALGRHFAAVDAHDVVACVGFYPEGEGAARLRHMAVAPHRQGEGLGAQLLDHAEACVRDGGVTRIETHARCTARGFYEKRGYRAEGAEFDEHTIPHIFMWKALVIPTPAG